MHGKILCKLHETLKTQQIPHHKSQQTPYSRHTRDDIKLKLATQGAKKIQKISRCVGVAVQDCYIKTRPTKCKKQILKLISQDLKSLSLRYRSTHNYKIAYKIHSFFAPNSSP